MFKVCHDFIDYAIEDTGSVFRRKSMRPVAPFQRGRFLQVNLRKSNKTVPVYVHDLLKDSFPEVLGSPPPIEKMELLGAQVAEGQCFNRFVGYVLTYIDGNSMNPSLANLGWRRAGSCPVQVRSVGKHTYLDMPGEVWRSVKDSRDYMVSDIGRVKRIGINPMILASNSRPYKDNLNLPYVWLRPSSMDGEGLRREERLLHEVVGEAFYPDLPPGYKFWLRDYRSGYGIDNIIIANWRIVHVLRTGGTDFTWLPQWVFDPVTGYLEWPTEHFLSWNGQV